MNYIVTNKQEYFQKIGDYNYCNPEDIILPYIIGVDSETEGLEARNPKQNIFCIQIGTGTNNYIIDLETISFEEMRPLLYNKVMIFHNATFDLGWFYQKFNFWPEQVGDTMIASMILHNGKKEYNGAPYRHGFGWVMERELGLKYDKGEQKNIHKIKLSTARSIEYCFNDVDRLLDLHTDLVNKLTATQAIPAYRIHRRYIKALAYMEQCGLPVNTEKWKEKIRLDKIDLKKKEEEVIKYICENLPEYQDKQLDMFSEAKKVNINLGSPQQVIPIFEAFGINVENPEDKEKKSIKEDVISKTKHPFVKLWLDMQEIKHDISTYGENLLGRIENEAFYTTFKPILDTARISTRREGINIMNFPKGKKTRGCFVAHPGMKMIVCDYEGQETRTGADITEDVAMTASIVNDADLHCAFVRVLNPELQDADDEIIKTVHADKRQAAKAPRFCFQFGGTGFTLHQNEGIPLEEAMKIEAAFKELHYGVYEYGERKFKEAVELGYITSTAGFRLYLTDWKEFKESKAQIEGFSKDFWAQYREGKIESRAKWEAEDKGEFYRIQNPACFSLYKENAPIVSRYFKKKSEYFKLCLNSPTQATAAFQTKEAVARIFEYILKKGHQWIARIAAVQHDEVIMEVREDLVEEYKKVIETSMIEGGNIFLTKGLFSMSCAANAADSWYEAK